MKTKKQMTVAKLRRLLRQAVADYIGSEGCSCCRGNDHDAHRARLGELLGVPKYPDGSGHDFGRFRPKEDTNACWAVYFVRTGGGACRIQQSIQLTRHAAEAQMARLRQLEDEQPVGRRYRIFKLPGAAK